MPATAAPTAAVRLDSSANGSSGYAESIDSVTAMGMKLAEAVSILSEYEHRGTDAWILSKSTTYYRGTIAEKNVIVVPAPNADGLITGSLTPFEALAIASSYKRNEFQQALEDDVRLG